MVTPRSAAASTHVLMMRSPPSSIPLHVGLVLVVLSVGSTVSTRKMKVPRVEAALSAVSPVKVSALAMEPSDPC